MGVPVRVVDSELLSLSFDSSACAIIEGTEFEATDTAAWFGEDNVRGSGIIGTCPWLTLVSLVSDTFIALSSAAAKSVEVEAMYEEKSEQAL